MRRLAGPAAGLLAAAIQAISPATVSLNRGNVPDTLMILLAALGADAVVTAVVTGRLRPVLLAGAGPAPVLPVGVYYCGPFVFLRSVG